MSIRQSAMETTWVRSLLFSLLPGLALALSGLIGMGAAAEPEELEAQPSQQPTEETVGHVQGVIPKESGLFLNPSSSSSDQRIARGSLADILSEYGENPLGLQDGNVSDYAEPAPESNRLDPPQDSAAEPNPPSSLESELAPGERAIAVSALTTITVPLDRSHNYPITLSLVQPFLDPQGRTIAPTNALVSASLEQDGEMIRMVATGVVVNGRMIPIRAESPGIPIGEVARVVKTRGARIAGLPVKDILSVVGGLVQLSDRTREYLDLAGIGLDVAAGKGASRSVRGIQVPQGSIHILMMAPDAEVDESH